MNLYFESDPRKARTNFRKHGISFDEAASVFKNDASAYTDFDELHSEDDPRFFTIGAAENGKLLYIVHNENEAGEIRLISARAATPRERRLYEEG